MKDPILNTGRVYQHGDYLIEIITDTENYSAWICGKDSGVKMLIFEMPKNQQHFWEFRECVEARIEEEIAIYEEQMEMLETAIMEKLSMCN